MPDGSGGLLVVSSEVIDNVDQHLYATRITSAGKIVAGWEIGGTAVSIGPTEQTSEVVSGDGGGGIFVAWADSRTPAKSIFAQHVDGFGQLGDTSPTLTAVRDVAADQGGHVRLDWNASWLDTPSNPGIASYWIWRQAPVAMANAAVAHGARMLEETDLAEVARGGEDALRATASRGLYTQSLTGTSYAWEFMASQPASGFPTYSYVASTTTDSTAGHDYRTTFMVQARAASGAFWNSAPDSGASVDNLAPVAPATFTATYGGGSARLHWSPNTEPDLGGYRLYRGATTGFTPSSANLIATPSDTGYVDDAGSPFVYKLSAVDVHGNESSFSTVALTGAAGVEPEHPIALALSPIAPNPTRGPMALRFTLPREAQVELAIVDVTGRQVARVAAARFPAGSQSVDWSGRDDIGRPLASGLYLAVLSANGERRVQRFAIVR